MIAQGDEKENQRLFDVVSLYAIMVERRLENGKKAALMPKEGVEPSRGHPHTILSRARLPVPPLRQKDGINAKARH
jgi:hypothetical protein